MIGLVDRSPTLGVVGHAWAHGWEIAPEVLSCAHEEFEAIRLIRPGIPDEIVVRCSACTAPRCGNSDDPNPCMRIRHHRDNQPKLLRNEHLPYSKAVFIPDLSDEVAVERWLVQ